MTERDEERDRLRKELQKSREQLHALHEKQEQNGKSLNIFTGWTQILSSIKHYLHFDFTYSLSFQHTFFLL